MKLLNHLAVSVAMVLLCAGAFAQTRGITGTVSDNTGAPLRGVIVYVQGSTENTMTGDNGTYVVFCTLHGVASSAWYSTTTN